jgi:hypothetical protein
MSNITNIKIGRKSYKLKFGYGVNRRLSKVYELTSYSALGDYIQSLKFGGDDLTFDQIDFLGNLVLAAIAYELGEDPNHTKDEVVDVLLANPETLANIMEAYMASFPKVEPTKGKPKPQPRKKK